MNTQVNAPYVTEKTLAQARRGYYSFVVDVHSRKPAIQRLISDLYKVHVIDVRTIMMPGKTRRAGKKLSKVNAQPWKKALVRLAQGETIDAFEVTKESEKKEPEKK